MANTFLKWLQNFIYEGQDALEFLTSKPFSNISVLPDTLKNLTPLALIGLSGLMAFIIVAIVKWVVN